MESDRTLADEQAADWFARLQTRSVSTAELTEFARWRREEMNSEAYRRVEALWSVSGMLGNDPDVADAVAAARAKGASFRGGRRRTMAIVAVAAACVMIVGASLLQRWFDAPTYRTAVGERSWAMLADGSRLHLDSGSVVTARFDDSMRQVVLDRGQLFLDVAHDAERPLVVDVGEGITVKAVGTRFDVLKLGDLVRVALLQGTVEVRRRGDLLVILKQGQVLEVRGEHRGVVSTRSAAEVSSWRTGRLSFEATPLEQAVAEMNRYTNAPLVIAEGADGSRTVSGDFSIEDPEGFAKAVETLLGKGTLAARMK